MPQIDYLAIFKKAWNIVWSNKYLWWFGFFLALGSGGLNFNFNIGEDGRMAEKVGAKSQPIINFFQNNVEWVVFLSLFLLAVFIILLYLRIVSQAGILKALESLEKKEASGFKAGFKKGKPYFWRILTLDIIFLLVIISMLIIFSIPIIFLFASHSFLAGGLITFFALCIFIPIVFLAAYIRKYAIYYLVLSGLTIRSALENGYLIFRKNILASIIMSLLFIPVAIILAVGIIGLLLAIGIIFFLPGLAAYLIFSGAGIAGVVIMALVIFIAALMLLQSVYAAFFQTVWYLFFKEVATLKEEETAGAEAEIIAEKVSEAGV